MDRDENLAARTICNHAGALGGETASGPDGAAPSSRDGAARGAIGPKRPVPSFPLIDSATFARADYKLDWLIPFFMVRGQPGVIGGPRKSLKTSLMVDLALSLGTGGRFLGHFEAQRPVRTVVLSGESGEATVRETALRICREKGIDLEKANVFWGFRLPQLADLEHLAALKDALQECGAEVLLMDPLYLALLSGCGAGSLSASNLYHVGPLLFGVAQACLAVGCTPLLVHHFRITRANPYDEPQLEDLAFAGIQEFARQWVLIGRREKYQPGTGSHRLWLSVGGSAGHSGAWSLDIEEGAIGADFNGRTWRVDVQSASEARQEQEDQETAAKESRRELKLRESEANLLSAVDDLAAQSPGGVASYNRARDRSGLSGTVMGRLVERLIAQGVLEEADAEAATRSGGKRLVRGLRRCRREKEREAGGLFFGTNSQSLDYE